MQGSKGKDWQALTDDIHSQYNTHLSEENTGEGNNGTVGQSVLLRHTHPIPQEPPQTSILVSPLPSLLFFSMAQQVSSVHNTSHTAHLFVPLKF